MKPLYMLLKIMVFIFLPLVLVRQRKKETSGTLNAMEVPQSLSDSAVRVSLDENNTIEEARQFNQVFDVLYAKFSKING
ncbi:hypothetical protein [Apilactobacillus ozensis]|uniref:hypothetical protein n=1 Tax=Apilactobacillus ozensis TaxID=866801 RepID=UPI000AA5CBA2|nr:hypothetical protein [Apilactobacillus ozensis]